MSLALRGACGVLLAMTIATAGREAAAQPLAIAELAMEGSLGPIGIFNTAFTHSALAADGTVAFLGSAWSPVPQAIYLVGAASDGMLVVPAEFQNLSGLAVQSGSIVFVAERSGVARGVYRVPTAAAQLTPPPWTPGAGSATPAIETVFELAWPVAASDPRVKDLALSPNGTLAFSTIVNGQGALYRGPVQGPVSVLRQGSGTFFNTRTVDVNDAGQVAVEMEYGDPSQGLSRGVLLFDSPGQGLADITTAISKLGVGSRARHRLAEDGTVIIALDLPATLSAFGTTVGPGLYRSTPTPFGQAPSLVTLAAIDATTAFTRIQRFGVGSAGVVAFEGAFHDGSSGIYVHDGSAGPPAAVVPFGGLVSGRRLSFLSFIDLNDAQQLALFISDFLEPNRYVWRVSGFVPAVTPPPAQPAAAFTCQPGTRAACNWMGVCAPDGAACVCDDPLHWWPSDTCSAWHATPPLAPGQLCAPGDRAYCNWMGACDGSGQTCVCDDPAHWSPSTRCGVWTP